MFAVIKTGGKQYTVKEGDVFNVEKINVEAGKTYSFGNVLIISNEDKLSVGSPYIEGAFVEAEVVSHGKAPRVFVFKRKRRKDYRKRQGHRQQFTKVKITKIVLA